MVQIVENWSQVQGRVVGVVPASGPNGFSAVQLDVHAAATVDGFPNLLARHVGERLDIFVPDALAHTLSVGQHVAWRARRAGPHKVFATTD